MRCGSAPRDRRPRDFGGGRAFPRGAAAGRGGLPRRPAPRGLSGEQKDEGGRREEKRKEKKSLSLFPLEKKSAADFFSRRGSRRGSFPAADPPRVRRGSRAAPPCGL